MATIYKRGSVYYCNWREDGVQVRRSLGAIDRKAAEAFRAEKEAELRGLITPTRGLTVGAVLDEYMGWYRLARPTTYRRAVSALKRFRMAYDNLAAESLPQHAVEVWAEQQPARGQTEKALKLATAAFRRAIKHRRLAVNPLQGVSVPKSLTSKAPPWFRREQLRALARTPRGALWIFMVATGVRRAEMAKAVREDVRDGLLVVESSAQGRTKSGKWRAVPLNSYALRALRSLGPGPLAEVTPDTLSKWFREDARSVGVKGRLHDLRHTFCTILAQQGVSLHQVKALAGHSSITITEKYAHHCPDLARPAVATMASWRRQSTQKSTRRA